MRLFAMGHEDLVLGFSLIGVEGFATDDPSEAWAKLEEVIARGDVALILVTPGLARRLGDRLRQLEQGSTLPLVLEVPAPGEPLERPPVRDLVRRAVKV